MNSMYEFVKYGKNYIVKNSNGRIVSEKEKIQMENKELILKDITGCGCQKETTKKLTKNKKRLKEIEEAEIKDISFSKLNLIKPKAKITKKETLEEYIIKNKDDANDIIQETTETI